MTALISRLSSTDEQCAAVTFTAGDHDGCVFAPRGQGEVLRVRPAA